MIKNVFRKSLVIGIIILFLGASVIPSLSINIKNMSDRIGSELKNNLDEDIIYIHVNDDSTCPGNGSKEWPYCKIQYAIDNASAGNTTIYVYSGKYFENVQVNKTVTLEGKDEELDDGDDTGNPIIDGNEIDDVVNITADGVKISNFTIRNSGDDGAGIKLYSSTYTYIFENIIENNDIGIKVMEGVNNNSFYHNNLFDNHQKNASDAGNNNWYYDIEGNYEGNYWGDNVCVDDDDGICDTSYDIPDGENRDEYPLVHPYGSIINNNTGDIFLTIQNAIDDPNAPGHTIYVKNGTYYENLQFIDKEDFYLSLEGE
ncbi:MAG: NosD domain-containing protein, partial [Candidatus Hodarchaeota archaeon]